MNNTINIKRIFLLCDTCHKFISRSNFARHRCNKRVHVPIDQISIVSDKGDCVCLECGMSFSKMGIATHFWRMHTEDGKIHKSAPKIGWSKGLTKETDIRIAERSKKNSLTQKGRKGRPHTEQERKNISIKMKIAHAEGRAWNIGKSRWNNEHSYPEKFFALVIENEFENKEYVQEFPMGIFSIDFAWPILKRAIEIDGDQHKIQEYVNRDLRKNNLLNQNGWEILRIPWNEMYMDTKHWIFIAKSFIHS